VIHAGDLLYDDDYCELSEEFLEIKRYFFPTMKPVYVRVEEIRVVWFQGQTEARENARPKVKSWGYTKGKSVYWAVDFKRCMGKGERAGKSDCVVETTDGEFVS